MPIDGRRLTGSVVALLTVSTMAVASAVDRANAFYKRACVGGTGCGCSHVDRAGR
jgi:hypothetical protein